MEKDNVIEQCFKILWYMTLAYFIEVPLISSPALTRVIWIPSIVLLAFSCLRVLIIEDARFLVDARKIGFILISFILLLFGIILGNSIFSDKHWVALLSYITQLLSVVVCCRTKIRKRTFDTIFYIAVACTILFSLYSLTSIAYKVTTGGRVWYTIYYVFNLDYSNLAGIYLFCLFSILLINFKYRKRKLLLFLLIAYTGWMIYKTNTRSCIISAVAVVIIYIFFNRNSIPRWVILGCMIFPVVFAYLYTYLFQSGYLNRELLGKNLFTGRQDIFYLYLSNLNGPFEWIFGNFGANALQNAHNGPVSILTSIGILGLIAHFNIYYKAIDRINSMQNTVSTTCVVCILGIFIQTSAEATMMLGGFPGIVLFGTMFLLAGYNNMDEDILTAR